MKKALNKLLKNEESTLKWSNNDMKDFDGFTIVANASNKNIELIKRALK